MSQKNIDKDKKEALKTAKFILALSRYLKYLHGK